MAETGTDRTDGRQLGSDRPDHGYGVEHRRASRLRDWRLKAAIQTLLGWLPQSEQLNYLLQRHVTRTLPIGDGELAGQVAKAQRNVDAFRRLHPKPLSDAHLYEFGVGWDLLMPLVYYCMGVERQTVIDLKPLARVELIRDIAERLALAARDLGLPRWPVLPDGDRSTNEIAASWGIDYRAPADARDVDLPAGSVEMVTSCDVLEHVPIDDIGAILTECWRILGDDGILRIRIDYQDHYWYFDSTVSPYNFLRFGSRAWRRYNPSLHYQNRIRHSELLGLIRESGFDLLEDDHPAPTAEELELLDATPLAREFRFMPRDILAIRYANLSLGKSERSADNPEVTFVEKAGPGLLIK